MAKNARLTKKMFVQFIIAYHLAVSVCASFWVCVCVWLMIFLTFISTVVVFDVVEGDRIKIDPIYLIETLH